MYDMIKKIEHKGYTIKVKYDDDNTNNPRDWDNLGSLVCFHKRYDLGDKHTLTQDDLQELVTSENVIALPVFMYDHSNISLSTSPFSCQFDSGQIGYIYVTKEKLIKEQLADKTKEEIETYLKNEIEIYNKYLNSEVYSIEIVKNNTCTFCNVEHEEHIESCYGFFDLDDCINEAKSLIDSLL